MPGRFDAACRYVDARAFECRQYVDTWMPGRPDAAVNFAGSRRGTDGVLYTLSPQS
jgi:hypothetical protein